MSNGNGQDVDIHIRGKVDGSLKAAAGDARNTIGDLKAAVVDNTAQMTGVNRDLLSTVTSLAPRFLLVGAAVGTLAKAYADGAAEVRAMNLAIGKGGDISGQSAASLRGLSAEMASNSQLIVAESKSITQALAASGQIGAGAFRQVSLAAGDFARVMSTDVERVGPELVKLFADPEKGAEALNKQMHFLSVAELDRIERLARTGEVTQAQIELAGKLRERMGDIVPQLGYVESAWNTLKGAASLAWDAMMGIGREVSPHDALKGRLAAVNAQIKDAENSPLLRGHLPGLMQKALALQDQLDAEAQKSFDKSQAAEKNRRDQTARTLANSLSKNARAEAIDDEIKLLEAADLRADIKAQAIAKKREERARLFKEKAGSKSPLDKMLELGQRRIDVLNNTGYDEQTVSVDSVARQYAAQEEADLEKRRIAMEQMAEARMENTRIATEGEEAIRESMEKTNRTIKETDNFAKDLGLTFASAFEDAVIEGRKFSDVLQGLGKDIARILLRKTVTEPMADTVSTLIKGSGVGDFFKGIFTPGNHAGGIAGSEATFMRAVSPAVFAGAPRLHAGGIAGDEVPTILKRGEGVFTPGQMKALGSGGGDISNLRVEIINPPGRPAQVESVTPRIDAKGLVVSVVLGDIANNGPIAQGLTGRFVLRGASA